MIQEIKKGHNQFPVLLVEALPLDKILVAQSKEDGIYYLVQYSDGFFDYLLVKLSNPQSRCVFEISEDKLLDENLYKLYMLDSLKEFAELEVEGGNE